LIAHKCKNAKNNLLSKSLYKHLTAGTPRVFLIVGILLLQISCGPSLRKEVGLKKTSLIGISRVAVVASSNPPEVSYANVASPGWTPLLFILSPIVVGAIQAMTESSMDKDDAKQIGSRTDPTVINDIIVNTFLASLSKDGRLGNVEYVKEPDERKLLDAGYDTGIQLTVLKISFSRVMTDKVRLYVNVKGTMKALGSKEVIWDREEIVASRDAYALEYYKENAMKELRSVLEKAGRNLAYDFRYLE
jgi:hypothetical protein